MERAEPVTTTSHQDNNNPKMTPSHSSTVYNPVIATHPSKRSLQIPVNFEITIMTSETEDDYEHFAQHIAAQL